MNKEFRTIVVDNKTNEIIGNVTDFQSLGFSLLYRQQEKKITLSFDNIDALLDWTQTSNTTIYYMIGGVHIPVSRTTYEKKDYLHRIGWWNLTPAEAIIFGALWEEKCTQNGRLTTQNLQDILKAFGFKPTSLRTLIVNLRKKLSDTTLQIQNEKQIGYQIIDPHNDLRNEFIMQQSILKSDYWILLNDKKLKNYVIDKTEHFMWIESIMGSQILRGWQGLTRQESEIYFELVKFRTQWVNYEHLLGLSWAMEKKEGKEPIKRRLIETIRKIKSKIAAAKEVIINRRNVGYKLK